jgi:hypothetical protein
MLAAEGIARPSAGRSLDTIGRCARRHRENDGDALGAIGASLPASFSRVRQKPIVVQRTKRSAIGNAFPVLRFGLKASVARDVVEVRFQVAGTATGPARDLHHSLRRLRHDALQTCFGGRSEGAGFPAPS